MGSIPTIRVSMAIVFNFQLWLTSSILALGEVAQLVEHRFEAPSVVGSIPILSIPRWVLMFIS